MHFVVKLSMFLSKWRRNSLCVFQMLSILNGVPKLNGASIHYVELFMKLRCKHFYLNQIIHVFIWNTCKVLPSLDRVCSWIGLKMRFMLCMLFSLCLWTKNLQQAIFFYWAALCYIFPKKNKEITICYDRHQSYVKKILTPTHPRYYT